MFSLEGRDLNDEQKAAILADGSVFLEACPGSGKTRTLTYKIAFELSRLTSERQFILAITYTHRAADEIRERIESLGIDTRQLWIGTIHAFCLEWILRPYGIYHERLKNGFSVIGAHQSEQLFEELCGPYQSHYPRITAWDCKFHLVEGGYVLQCGDARKHASIQEILKQYFDGLAQARQIDFELILYYAYQLVSERPSISILLSNIFPFVLIDEYQDTKAIQYSIIASILRAGKGLMNALVVGDPNQAIYGSLGGLAMNPDEFGCMSGVKLKKLTLSLNYRSSERIIRYFSNFNVHPTRITPASKHKDYPSLITFNSVLTKGKVVDELARLVTLSVDGHGISPNEICILGPQWSPLASTTRKLMAKLPQYQFDGPGMVPFARDMENFWYKFSRIVLTEPSPHMYVRRLRWAGELLTDLQHAGINVSHLNRKIVLRESNSIDIDEVNGLAYLKNFFDAITERLGIDISAAPLLEEQQRLFFEGSQERIGKMKSEGAELIDEVSTFRRVFAPRSGITISTIHGVKGAEYDVVIAYALLQGMVPYYADADGETSAKKLLYVIASRARKNIHLISETGRRNVRGYEYEPTFQLRDCVFDYSDA